MAHVLIFIDVPNIVLSTINQSRFITQSLFLVIEITFSITQRSPKFYFSWTARHKPRNTSKHRGTILNCPKSL